MKEAPRRSAETSGKKIQSKQNFIALTDKDKLNAYVFMFCAALIPLAISYMLSGVSLYFGVALVINSFLLTIIIQYKIIIWSKARRESDSKKEDYNSK